MTDLTRRAGLRVSAALAAASLSTPWSAFAQASANAANAATPPGATPSASTAASAASATAAVPDPQQTGPDGPLLATRLKYEGVAMAAMQVRDGAATYSSASARGKLPDDQTLFELGSITKTFTALLLADAVTRGLTRLDAPVEAVLPDGLKLRDSQDRPLRWIDLATHRSGLPRMPSNIDDGIDGQDPYAHYGWPQMAAFLKEWKAVKPRDLASSYSNLGFGLLGQALGFLQKTDYPTLLTTRVLKPLGLVDQIFLTAPPGRRFLDGHNKAGQRVSHWNFRPAMAGAGALVGSTRGLARYAQAALGQFDHPLKDAFQLCLREHAEGEGVGARTGLAWQLGVLSGRPAFHHGGETYGFIADLWLDPTKGSAAALLSNAPVTIADLALHLVEPKAPVLDMALTRQAVVTLTPEQLAPLEGVYLLSPTMKIRMMAQGNRLFSQATGQQAFELFPKSPREFFAKVTPLEIIFDPGTGPAPALTVRQGGRDTRASREP